MHWSQALLSILIFSLALVWYYVPSLSSCLWTSSCLWSFYSKTCWLRVMEVISIPSIMFLHLKQFLTCNLNKFPRCHDSICAILQNYKVFMINLLVINSFHRSDNHYSAKCSPTDYLETLSSFSLHLREQTWWQESS